MKRLIPAVMCLAAALWLSAGSYMYIKSQTAQLCAAADAVLSSENEAFENARSLCEKWEKVRVPFGSLLKHSDADELEKCFILMHDSCEASDIEALLKTAEDCRTALQVVLEGEKLSIANIF